MYTMMITLYGSFQARESARSLLLNLQEVKREEQSDCSWKIKVISDQLIKESSLIPLLRRSGIQGFRLENY